MKTSTRTLPKTALVDGKRHPLTWETSDDVSGWFSTVKTGLSFRSAAAAEDHAYRTGLCEIDGVDSAKIHADGAITLKIRA